MLFISYSGSKYRLIKIHRRKLVFTTCVDLVFLCESGDGGSQEHKVQAPHTCLKFPELYF